MLGLFQQTIQWRYKFGLKITGKKMVKFSQHVLWKLFCELKLRFRGRATVPVKRRTYTPRLWGKNFFFFSSRIHELLSRLLQSPPRNLWISFPIGWFSNSLSSLIRQLDCERGDQMWWQICLIPLKLIQFKMGNTADYCVTDKDTWIALCTRHKLYTYNLYSYTHEKKKIIQQWTLLCHWGIGSTAGWKV